MNTYPAILATFNIQEIFQTVQEGAETLGTVGTLLLALAVFLIGKCVAKGVSKLVEKGLSQTSIDDKIAAKLGHNAGVSKGVAGFVFGLLLLFVVVAALNVAKFDFVSAPLTNLLTQILDFLPKLLLAGVFTYVVVLVANLVKQLLSSLLSAAKLDERLGSATGTAPVSNSIVTAVYCLLLLLFTPAILDVLGIEAVSAPIKSVIATITSSVGPMLVAGVLLTVGCMIGNIAKRLVVNLLEAMNVNALPAKIGFEVPTQGPRSVSGVVGVVVMISIVVLTFTSAIDALKIEILSSAAKGLVAGYFNILLAILVFGGGLLGAKFAFSKLVNKNELLAKVTRIAIIVLTSVIALKRSGLAPSLTDLPFTVAIYSVGVAFAIGGGIALGLGGKEFVSRVLSKRG